VDSQKVGLESYLEYFRLNVYVSYNGVNDFVGRDILEPLY